MFQSLCGEHWDIITCVLVFFCGKHWEWITCVSVFLWKTLRYNYTCSCLFVKKHWDWMTRVPVSFGPSGQTREMHEFEPYDWVCVRSSQFMMVSPTRACLNWQPHPHPNTPYLIEYALLHTVYYQHQSRPEMFKLTAQPQHPVSDWVCIITYSVLSTPEFWNV